MVNFLVDIFALMLSDKTSAKTLLGSSSSEFAQLEYGLQLALKSTTATIIQAYALSNPHLTLQFEQRCREILTLESWIDSSMLCGANTEEDVIRRGFQFAPPQKGLLVCANVIDNQEPVGARKVLVCKIGVGRAYPKSMASVEIDPIPTQYDSFYVTSDTEESSSQYFIKNPAQILPMYLISYQYDPKLEEKTLEARWFNSETKMRCLRDQSSYCILCS